MFTPIKVGRGSEKALVHPNTRIHEDDCNGEQEQEQCDNVGCVPCSIVALESASRPRPLYVSTASQIGLLDTAGIPSLVDAALGPSAEVEVRRFMQRLLLHPPVPTLLSLAARLYILASASLP